MILTISIDVRATPNSVVQSILTAKHYTVPVLRGYEYSQLAGIRGTPTTWFVDNNGKLAFENVGGSPHLVQEFGWRLDAMRNSKTSSPSSTAAR